MNKKGIFYENKNRNPSPDMLTAQDTPFPKKWLQILSFHLRKGGTLLDPTCGEKFLWKEYFRQSKHRGFHPLPKYEITFSDTKDFGDNIVSRFQDLDFTSKFDGIVFDSPYIFDADKTDKNKRDYGGYDHNFKHIQNLISDANSIFPSMLKDNCLLFFKCSDVFSIKEKKFYFCGSLWIQILDNFVLKDMHIIIYHNISGTAWQVKDRPCSIVNYTYLFVLNKKGKKDEGSVL